MRAIESRLNRVMSLTRFSDIAFTLAVLLLLTGGMNLADTLTGEIRGGVLDTETGLALPAVAVGLLNIDRGWQRVAESDQDGNYVYLQLEPGNYTLTFNKEGYYPVTKTDILVRLNQPRVVLPPVQLRREVVTPTQQITVATPEGTKVALIDLTAPIPAQNVLSYVSERGYTALASLSDSAIRWNYDSSLLDTLPLRGSRTFDQLALFAPGVSRVPFTDGRGPAVGIGVGTAGQFVVNGLRGRSNNFTVDGSDNNDEDIGVRRQGFVTLAPQSVESVQEFQIMTAGFPADFGRNSASMANAVSRSGQSAHHGSVYGLFNNEALNARGFFDTPFIDQLNSVQNNGGSFADRDYTFQQFGGTAGGPVVARRLYYYSSIEHVHSEGTAVRHFVVPTRDERGLRVSRGAGDFVPIEKLEEFFGERNIPYSNLVGKGVLDLYPLPGPHIFGLKRRASYR
jgi:carboxypeptidase family protein